MFCFVLVTADGSLYNELGKTTKSLQLFGESLCASFEGEKMLQNIQAIEVEK